MPKPKFEITGIFVQDPTDLGYTGFFKEIPEAVAEGDSMEEAVNNLLSTLPLVLEIKSKMRSENTPTDYGQKTIRQTFQFELA